MVVDLTAVPLSALSNESRNILSSRLNPKKVIPIVGPDQLPRHRDWRGLASLAQISTEVAASINDYTDKTARVLEIWSKSSDGTATIAKLLDFLQLIDRFDVCEDLIDLHKENKLIVNPSNGDHQIVTWDENDKDIITYDDKLLGFPQKYHAYVLYAREDKDFVDELVIRMRSQGLKLCTEEDLLIGHPTRVEPVSRLILHRCRYTVLIYSSDFWKNSDIAFYTNLAHVDAINKQQIKLIPIKYRECIIPQLLAQYHCLHYMSGGVLNPYFWCKLSDSLRIVNVPRIECNSTSSVIIKELPTSKNGGINGFRDKLALPPIRMESSSMESLPTLENLPTIDIDPNLSAETKSLSNTSETSEKKKKTIGERIMNTLKGKKHKNNDKFN